MIRLPARSWHVVLALTDSGFKLLLSLSQTHTHSTFHHVSQWLSKGRRSEHVLGGSKGSLRTNCVAVRMPQVCGEEMRQSCWVLSQRHCDSVLPYPVSPVREACMHVSCSHSSPLLALSASGGYCPSFQEDAGFRG